MPKPRIKILDLKLDEIELEDLIKITDHIEERIREYLEQVLPPKSEYDIIVKAEHEGDKITLYLDIGIRAGYTDIMDYDKIIGDVINVARRIFEKELSRYRRAEELSPQ